MLVIPVATFRIWKDRFLNQLCAWMPDFESTLLALMPKIFLQQYLPRTDFAKSRPADIVRRHHATEQSDGGDG
jgi:hypothetical protein